MSAAGTETTGESFWLPKGNPWIIAIAVSLEAFMEVLDPSIANVALPHIAGNLGASNDESTWVLTSYLASNAIVLPTTSAFFFCFVCCRRRSGEGCNRWLRPF